ncbi:tyrosine-type recombinase/integrase (plasmid) [Bacillus velezensis]|uniref:tyrosine-type recombinase/integrase n=1 Tax=Bacillus velezensis TaxID=492670 RepID=UPI0020240407|nr:tyrosine-type recombinase/integrase [Bacillus velezensis]URJ76343.1 tyrosine-type recombinase/integrase [Bacillus velezensis]URJ80463.1 tyrosine-type recombinase/integrase [Bacillus velezensis]
MSSTGQVYKFRGTHNPHAEISVQDVYESFLSAHKRNSIKTFEEYNRRIVEFFQLTIQKHISNVTLQDIQSIKHSDIQTKYVDVLLERNNSANSILTKLHSVKSFYDDLLKNDLQVNPVSLKVRLKKDVKHHEALDIDEYRGLLDFMKEEKDGEEKYLYTKALFHTGQRRSATQYMRWEESFIQKKDSITGDYVWLIRVRDKGKQWKETPISDDFYNEIQLLNKGQEFVFEELSKSGAIKRYERSLKKYGKKIGKSLSIHCMKATAITIGWEMSRDMNLCKQLGGHSSWATTEIYIREEKSFTNQLSYSMSSDLDDSILDGLSHQELLDVIKKNEDIKNRLLIRLNKNKFRNIKKNH